MPEPRPLKLSNALIKDVALKLMKIHHFTLLFQNKQSLNTKKSRGSILSQKTLISSYALKSHAPDSSIPKRSLVYAIPVYKITVQNAS